MSTSGIRLSDALRLSMKKSAFDKTPYTFLAQGVLDSIITQATIFIAMRITKPTPEDCDLAAYILTKAKRLFATAAYIELRPSTLYRAMILFRNTNFTDDRLPLEEMSGEKFLMDVMSGRNTLVKLEGHVRSEAERIWTFRRVHAFLEEQFKFLAPIISTGKPDHDFGNLILPFVKKHAAQAEGSFGVIYQYEIHRDHFKIPAGQNTISNTCAVKEFKINHGSDRQEVAKRWASEVKALATMNTLNQDHIVRFIAAFSRGTPEATEHYLVTEWADGGNLHDLWKAIPNPPLTGSFVRAAIKQLRGLSDALCAIHYQRSDGLHTGAMYGRHGDLKPENVLWFRSSDEIGTLKIGDFGEAKSHQIVTAMRNSNTTARYGTRRYEPPECEIGIGTVQLGRRDMRRSRLYDIWSFGCITLEIIIWLLHGTKGLREFNEEVKTSLGNESPFYQVNHTGRTRSARVHKVVELWMEHISKDPACRAGTTALGDLLELVKRGLLVVKLPNNGGSVVTNNLLLPPQATFEEIPLINITPPEPPEPPESVPEGPVRYRADELRERLQLIESRHAEDSYWSTQLKLPLSVVTLDLCSMSTSHGDNKKWPQLNGDYSVPKISHTKAHIAVNRTFAAKLDHDQPEAFLNDQARHLRDNDDGEVHFTTRSRPRGSKNKRKDQMTRESTKTSSSTSSSSQPSDSKRPRIDRDDNDDQGEQDDKKRPLQGGSSKDSLANCCLACPFAKHLPLEYPQCRVTQFRDIAKIKEHLRKHHRMYCARCGEAFHTNSAWEEHSRQIEMCSIVDKARLDIFFTYMSDKQEAKISHGISWSGMYKVLFPDDAVPDNSFYEDSEALVFSLIDESHGSMGSSLRVFEAYRQNQRAESTCSARTALHYGWIATSTLSEAFQPSDSGYSAPEEYPPAGGPSALLVEDPDPVPQEHDSTCAAAAAHSSTTVPQHNADIDEGHLL